MSGPGGPSEPFSPWWRRATLIVLGIGFAILVWVTGRAKDDAPPIPERVVGPDGATLFGRDDILGGQGVFLRHGLMENGSVWGHGAYLGPDFPAAYLHGLAQAVRSSGLADPGALLKQNRFDAQAGVLTFTAPEAAAFELQRKEWTRYFFSPMVSRGLPPKTISDPEEIRKLTAFFAWAAWGSVANRPGLPYSYTSNFPYEPEAGNTPTADAVLWSALSLVALLGGTALVLFAFGRFDFLGWKGKPGHAHPQLLPGRTTESQRATILLFVLVSLLFLLQAALGGATAHYRADPGSFFGLDLSRILPSHLARTWHLQLAILWIATAFAAGGLFLAPALGGREPAGQARGVKVLLGALALVVFGSLAGEALGLAQRLGNLWFWLGHQGWEYLDLGRAWQVALVAGLLLWASLVVRGISPARRDPEKGEISTLFLVAALAIPLFYLPALFFGPRTHFTLVDTWRFWIIHLWVEGFFELFVTAMVAVIFFELGIISSVTARRVIYLDAILYMGGGIVGTGHHWYWTGQSAVSMALAALFSALEVVPLTLLTLDAADFVRLGRARCDVCGRKVSVPHRWTFRFLMAVGFWNFVGAGVFGFLVNLPVVSFFEVGTVLTPNHAHTAMMGVFGMLAVALVVFAYRQVLDDVGWARVEPWVRRSFWGLNGGLLLMSLVSLFPGGVLQLRDVLENGYWHARSAAFLDSPAMRLLEWIRLPADAVFIALGAAPLLVAGVVTLEELRRQRAR